jgi:hypothetical protein
MYPQRAISPFHLGFPQLPQRQMAMTPQGFTATAPAQQQQPQQQQSPLVGTIGNLALRKAFAAPAPLFGSAEAGAAADAADAASPYAADALLANGADPEIMAQLAAEGTTADLGLGAGATTAAGAAAGEGAAGAAAAEGAGAAAGEAGLLGASALGPIALGGLGIYGLGSLLDWW